MKENKTGAIILVVEDVEEIRDGIEELLRSNGYGIEAARDEAGAVRRARRRHPNLILISSAGPQADLIGSGRPIPHPPELSAEAPVLFFVSHPLPKWPQL